ncbi:MAG: penicillin-binding transpeptidase domain-containing protein, partial [Eubacteriales bacterium]
PLTVYAPAIEHGGYYPGSVFDDMPVKYSDGTSSGWSPVDYDTETSGWKGLITMRSALMYSVNVYAVQLFAKVGIEYGWQFAKNNLGLPLTDRDKVLSLSLGTCHVSTLDMATAYSTFPNNGIKTEPFSVTKVLGPDSEPLLETTPTKKRVMKETTAYLMNNMLRSVVTAGTGTHAKLGNWYICGKTGTTSLDPDIYGNKTGNPDAWFVGYSPKYTAVVWMGYDSDPDKLHYLYKVYGGSYPTSIWKQVMTVAHEDLDVQSSISRPNGITSVTFDKKSGLLPSSLTPAGFIATEIAASDSVPTSVSNVWVEAKVDTKNQNMLAPEGSLNTITKVFLSLPNRSKTAVWPPDELPYKLPTEYAEASSGDTTIENETPPSGDSRVPQPSISSASYNPSTTKVQIPLLSQHNAQQYSLILYIKRPNQPYLETFVPEESNPAIINYKLNLFGSGQVTSGTYTFWAALMNNSSFTVGPPSNPVTITIQ